MGATLMDKYLEILRSKHDKNREHCGFITLDDGVVEVDNHADDAKNNFEIAAVDVNSFIDQALATWHTHTHSSGNLSAIDFATFQSLPDCYHFIVASDKIWLYYTDAEGIVTIEERYHA